MGEVETQRVSSTVEFPGGAQASSQAAGGAQGGPRGPVVTDPVTAPPVVTATAPTDPLSRPYILPSRGLYYPDGQAPGGRMVISPTDGAQEEILAGAKDNPAAALPALRHVTEQCFDLKGLPFNAMLLFDWTAAMLHFLALSAGSDEIGLAPVHNVEGCRKASDQTRALTMLPCKVLRLAEVADEVNWPVDLADMDPDELAIREMEEERAEGGVTECVVAQDSLLEPFTAPPLPYTKQVIGWRYHRVSDLIDAEEFAQRTGDKQTKPGSKFHNYLLAKQMVSIDGRLLRGELEALTWVKRQKTPVLDGLREDIQRREFGYDMYPRFRCPHCGGSFRVRLPLDGSLFRRRRGR